MAKRSLSPGPAVFHALIDRYTRQGNSKQAHELYLGMIETGMKPLPDTFKVILTYLSDIYSILMKHESPKMRIWTTVQETQLMNREHVFEKAIDRIVHNTNPGANRIQSIVNNCRETGSFVKRIPKVIQLRTSKFNFTQNIKKSRTNFIDSHALFRSFKMHHFVTRLYKLPLLSIIYKKIPALLKQSLIKSPYIYPFIVADIYSQFRSSACENPKANNAVYCIVVLFFLDVDIYVSLKVFQDCIVDGHEPSFRMCSALATSLKLHGKFSPDCLPWGQKLRNLIPKPKYGHYDQNPLAESPTYPNIEQYDIFDYTEANIVAALLCVALGTDNTTQLKLKDFIDNNPVDDTYLPLLIRHCQIHNYWWILKSITDPVVEYHDESFNSTKILM
jgi:pentatricopeptide repeat protein